MQNFDEVKLISEIGILPPPLRVAFAAACAERQVSAYRQFEKHRGHSNPNALDCGKEFIAGWLTNERRPVAAHELCERLIRYAIDDA